MINLLVTFLLFVPTVAEQDATLYFPLTKGHTIKYTIEKQRQYELPDQTQNQTILGTTTYEMTGKSAENSNLPNVQTMRIHIKETDRDTNKTIENSMEVYLSSNGDSILWHGHKQLDSILGSGKSEVFDPPNEFLNVTKAMQNIPFHTNSSMLGLLIKLEMKSAKVLDSFETPIGKFSNVLKVVMYGTISGDIPEQNIEIIEGNMEETSWYVPNIGLVKSEENKEYTFKIPNGLIVDAHESKIRIIESYHD